LASFALYSQTNDAKVESLNKVLIELEQKLDEAKDNLVIVKNLYKKSLDSSDEDRISEQKNILKEATNNYINISSEYNKIIEIISSNNSQDLNSINN
jgi:hypothetical protein